MKVYGAIQSPFVRKVRLFAMETGQADAIEWIWVGMEDRAKVISQFNPLVKIPALVRDDGTCLYDSPVILEYLDSLHDGPKLHPAGGEARWQALRIQALGDGIADATVALTAESRRPADRQLPEFVARQEVKINNGLDALEGEVAALEGEPTIAPLAVAATIGYLDFRDPDYGWRETRPRLARWYEAFSARPAMQATIPTRP